MISRYGNFIADVVIDWCKADIEKNTLQVLESGQGIDIQCTEFKSLFYMEMMFFIKSFK